MQYRIDQKSGNELSALGFGCMRLPRGVSGRIDIDKTEKLVMSAIENGVNYFDTAYVYFGSEAAVGEVLHRNNAREDIFLATKLPFRQCKTYDDFDRLFNMQLAHLKTDYIDYYLIHNISETSLWDGLAALGIERWIADKKACGKIRQIGFSFHGSQKDFLALLDAYAWDFCQIQYNYVNENYQAGRAGLDKAHSMGIPVVVMEPLLGGKLATGLPEKAEKAFSDANAEITPAAWALRWLWDQPGVTVVLSGMNSAAQLEDNIVSARGAATGMLSDSERAVYKDVVKIFSESYKIPCTGCDYCMPCPSRVNIPGCFAAYNTSYVTGYISGITMYLTGAGATDPDKNYRSRNCVKCGRCEKLCPQHIKIRDSLDAVTKRLDPFWLNAVLKLVAKFR